MLIKLEQSDNRVLGFLASGRLTDNDYKNFLMPLVDKALAENPNIRLLFLFEGFRGWGTEAVWEDLTYGMEINSRVDRIAVVGDKRWERWMTRLLRLFTRGQTRHFSRDNLHLAWQWLKE